MAQRGNKDSVIDAGDELERDPDPDEIEEPAEEPQPHEFPQYGDLPTEDPTELPETSNA